MKSSDSELIAYEQGLKDGREDREALIQRLRKAITEATGHCGWAMTQQTVTAARACAVRAFEALRAVKEDVVGPT